MGIKTPGSLYASNLMISNPLKISLDDLNLSVRTSNCLRNEKIYDIGQLVSYKASDLMKIPNFGRKCLQEIYELLESLNLQLGTSLAHDYAKDEDPIVEEVRPTLEDEIRSYIANGLVLKIDSLGFSIRTKNCLNSEGISYLGDLVIKRENDLLNIPGFGKNCLNEIQEKLLSLNLYLGTKLYYWPPDNLKELNEQATASLLDNHHETLYEAFFRTLDKVKLDERKFHILQSRLGLNGPPRTLEDTAKDFGITRERVRQIQKKITEVILNEELWDDVLRRRLTNLLIKRSEPLYLDQIGKEDSWFAGFENNLYLLEGIINAFSGMDDINLIPVEKRKIITYLSHDKWRVLKLDLMNMLEYSLDQGYSMSDIEMFIESNLSKYRAAELSTLMYDLISKDLKFSVVNGDFILVSIGNTLASIIRVILDSSPHPLHVNEIVRIYEEENGISVSERYISSCLNRGNFYAFERGTYGIEKHLNLSRAEKDSIRSELESIVLSSNTNRQWHVREILEKSPYSHLDKYKIQIILESSKKLRYLGRGLWKVKSGDDELVDRMHIRKAVFEALKNHGGPMHVDELREVISEYRGVGEFFNLHPNEVFSRVDASTWGLLERDFGIHLVDQSKLKEHFYILFKEKGYALHKSELSECSLEPFHQILSDGQIFGILLSDNRIKAWHGGLIGLAVWNEPGRKTFTEVMKDIAYSIEISATTDQIVDKARNLLGYNFNKNIISSYLNRFGLVFDQDLNIWKRV